jgi:hypothetical protein
MDLQGGAAARLVSWRSHDRSQSWDEPQALENWPDGSKIVGDPWLQTDRRAVFHLVHTAVPGMVLGYRHSADAGGTWSDAVKITEGADRPVLGVSPSGKRLVIATYLAEKSASYPKEPLNANDPQLQAKVEAAFRHSLGIFCSEDRSKHWRHLSGPSDLTRAVPLSVVIDDNGRIASSCIAAGGGSRSLVCSTADGGKSWAIEELVAHLQPDRPHPFNGARLPVLALDGNSALHVAYIGPLANGLFIRRSENWREWSKPEQLSSLDAEETRLPAIAAFGPIVHVTWLERRGERWHAYYRGSKDAGANWSGPLRLSEPHSGSTLIAADGFDLVSDDDQSSIADDGAGIAHAVWAVSGHNSQQPGRIWHAAIEWRTVTSD